MALKMPSGLNPALVRQHKRMAMGIAPKATTAGANTRKLPKTPA